MSRLVETGFAYALSSRAGIFSDEVEFHDVFDPANDFLHLVRYIDHHLDTLPVRSDRFLYEQQLKMFLADGIAYPNLTSVDSEELYLARNLFNQVSIMGPKNKHDFMENFNLLLITTENMRHFTQIENYINHTIREADIMSNLLEDLLPTSKMDSHISTELRQAARLRNLLDNAFDLRSDYKQGQISILPTTENQNALFSAAQKILHFNR